jgi:hypothetical protein
MSRLRSKTYFRVNRGFEACANIALGVELELEAGTRPPRFVDFSGARGGNPNVLHIGPAKTKVGCK